MNTKKIITFLKNQEKKLAGKVTTASVDVQLWQNKADLAHTVLIEYSKYFCATSNIVNKDTKKYSEYLESFQIGSASDFKQEDDNHDEEFIIGILKLMIENKLPEENGVMNLNKLIDGSTTKK